MRNFLIFLVWMVGPFVLLVVIGGCSRRSNPPITSSAVLMVDDVVDQLVRLYPPAKTRLEFTHKADDPFGIALIERLRVKGYAVAEFHEDREKGGNGLALSYEIDESEKEKLIRLTMMVGNEVISRAYSVIETGDGANVNPLGPWARRV